MSFSDFKSIEQVTEQYDFGFVMKSFIEPVSITSLQTQMAHEKQQLDKILEKVALNSEAGRIRHIVSRIIDLCYLDAEVIIWDEPKLSYNEELVGNLDMAITLITPNRSFKCPFLIMIEAKFDDFEQGWGQCAAEMYASYQLNASGKPVYGVVTNGLSWEFGVFEDNLLSKELYTYALSDLEGIITALCFIRSSLQV